MHAAGYSPSVNVLLCNLSRTSRRSSSSMAWFSSALSFRTLTGSCSCVTSRGISCHDLSVLVSAVCEVSWIAMWASVKVLRGVLLVRMATTETRWTFFRSSLERMRIILGTNQANLVNIDQPANSARPQSLLTATPLAKSVTPVGSVADCAPYPPKVHEGTPVFRFVSSPSPYRSNKLRDWSRGATHMQQPGGVSDLASSYRFPEQVPSSLMTPGRMTIER